MGRRPTALVTLLGVSLALGAGGCRSGPPPDQAAALEASERASLAADELPTGADEARSERLRVRATVTGAVSFVYDGVQDVQITRVGGPGLNVDVFSMGFMVPVKLEDPKERFRWAFDLLYAYDGPGRYEFGTEAGRGFDNIALLIYLRAKDGSVETVHDVEETEAYLQFRDIREPCIVEIGEGQRTGSLHCPQLAALDGEIASMTIGWQPPH